ncbi:MAG: AEC family transporter [Clostridia bacterium]|nr:AEC family transporter [Clostridia bacterium]
MNFFPALLTIMLTLFALIVCGFICRKTKVIDTPASKALSRLILAVGQPMLVISALSRAEYSRENLTIAWQVTLIGFSVHALLALLSYFICKTLKKDFDEAKIFEFSLVFANAGFIGFPVLDAIFGSGIGSFMGAFYTISFHLFLWTWGILIFGRKREDIKLTPKKIFLNFGTVPCAIGLVLYLCKGIPGFAIPDFADKFFGYLAGLCTPISVLVTGALLATISLKEMLKTPKLYLHSAIKLILYPLFFCVLAKLLGLPDNYVLLVTALTGVPSAATVSMLAEVYDIKPGFASQTVGLTSVLSVATLPLVMLFANWIITL